MVALKRRDFLKNLILLGTGSVLLPQLWTVKAAEAAWKTDGNAVGGHDPLLGIPIQETDFEFSSLQNRETTDAIVIHHVGNTNRDVSAAEIDRWHKNNGWAGIGYHFVIRKDGTIERGRYYGIAPDRKHIVGHRDFNSTACPGQNLYYKLPRLVTMTRKYY